MRLGEFLVAAVIGGGLALVVAAWLTDPTTDAGCDDPRMVCSEAGTSPAHFNTITIQESR